MIKWYRMNVGVDNSSYEGSRDQQNFQAWKQQTTSNAPAGGSPAGA